MTTKIIVKYANRKLYDRESAKYVNVADLVKLPMGSFTVVRHGTEEDVTVDTLLQALSSTRVNTEAKLEVMKHCVGALETSLRSV